MGVVTPAEAQVLLSMAAAFDNRKPDPDAAKAWSVALDGLRFEDCRDALVAHYRGSTEWLMPAMVRTAVRRMRAKRIEEHPPVIPPPGLSDVEERRFLAEARRRIGDGETYDSAAPYGELVSDVPRLRELLAAAQPEPTSAAMRPNQGEPA